MDNTTPTMQMADKYMFQTYARFPLTLVKGNGCRVWDDTGKEYIDFVGGIAVCALGHSAPVVTQALREQAETLVHVSNLYYTKPQIDLAKLLVENSFADRVFFCNSGAEANEAAIKLARRYAGKNAGKAKHTIVSMTNSFHGRTMATLSATGQSKIQIGFDPLLKGFKFVPFNDLGGLEKVMDESVCAVMVEPIQGEGGVICPSPDYMTGLRKLCNDRGVLLIFDEVQVGLGRTGTLFAHEHFNVTPDIMTLAKALGNGLPVGAMLAVEKLAASFGPGSHATTFGGTPLVTAVSKAVLQSILEDGWLQNARDMGHYMMEALGKLVEKYDCIKEVRGKGLIIGLELNVSGASIVKSCMEKGFLIICTHDTILRFLPPLIIGKQEIDQLVTTLDGIFEQM